MTVMYGSRARVGYTSPPMTTEVFPRNFYTVMPPDVSLVITTLAVISRTQEELDRSLEISRVAAKRMAEVGVNMVVLGGVPINLSAGGPEGLPRLLAETEEACGVPVSSSLSAAINALNSVGASRVGIVQPFEESHAESYNYLDYFGFHRIATQFGGYTGPQLGRISSDVSVKLAHNLVRESPDIDTIYFPCPHWAVIERIDEIERDLGVNVVASGQAIFWEMLRLCGIDDPVPGFGRLLSAEARSGKGES
jgi:maleate isomerase